MKTERTTVRRRAQRGFYDRSTVKAILDEALVCHLAFAVDGQPYGIPTMHARVDQKLYVHGATGNRALSTLRNGAPCCLTATLVDGLVLARSAFHHSMNYRSVVVLGSAAEVTEIDEKRSALHALVDKIDDGRGQACRLPNDDELRATLVLRLPLQEASAKVRTGPPVDAKEDYALPYWAGVIPLHLERGAPVPDPLLAPDIAYPSRPLASRPANEKPSGG
ncbi:MAG: pyridoxamine 5'-phosphate oxidase family protein [Myxococcota bacterium]